MCLAVPGMIESIEGEGDALHRRGKVSFDGAVRVISLACVPQARVGDYVLVHVGFAMQVLDEAEARETLSLLAEMRAAVEADAPPDLAPGGGGAPA